MNDSDQRPRIDLHGQIYNVDHDTRDTTGTRPSDESTVTHSSQVSNNPARVCRSPSSPPSPVAPTISRAGPLPSGWDKELISTGCVYFADHNTNTTTWDDPSTLDFNVPQYKVDLQRKLVYVRSSPAMRAPPGDCHVKIRRNHIFKDSYVEIMRQTPDDLKKRLIIEFDGEDALDYRGLSRELFCLLSRCMSNPFYGMFEYSTHDKSRLQIYPASSVNAEQLDYFKFIGRFVGLGIFHRCPLDVSFIVGFCKMMLDKKVILADLESMDAELHHTLTWVLQNDITDLSDENFTVAEERYDKIVTIELTPGGADIEVNEDNKTDYVNAMVEYYMYKRVEGQFRAFMSGFNELIPRDLITVFDEHELDLLIGGLSEIDVDDWIKFTDYSGYNVNDNVIQWFWKCVRSWPPERKSRLLQFATGISRIPVMGFRDLQGSDGPRRFTIEKSGDPSQLPESHVRFNRINLPWYNDYASLEHNLTLAIENNNSIDHKPSQAMDVNSPNSRPSSPMKVPVAKTSSPPPETNTQRFIGADKVNDEGNKAFEANEFDAAIELYTEAIEIWPDPAYFTNRATSYMAIKAFRPALEDCQRAVALQSASPSPKALTLLARCQLIIESPASALSTIFSALSIDPSNEAALKLRKEALELDAHLIAETVKDKGNKAFEAEKFHDAIGFYTEAIKLRLDPVYLTNRAASYVAIKKFQPALEDCQQAATLQSAFPSLKTLTCLARCQLVIDSPASALSTLSSALSIEPSNEAALQLQKVALELDAHLRADKMSEEGNVAFKAKKFDDAIELYTEAIEIWQDPVYLTNRAASYMAIKKFRSALEDCQQAAILQSASPSPKTLIRLARCQLVVDSPTATLSTIFSVLSIEPSNEAALQLRKEALELDAHLIAETVKDKGNKAFEAQKFNDAIEFYTEAIKLRLNPVYLTNRAASYMAIKKFRPALEDCQRAVALQSASPSFETLIHLARCQLVVDSPASVLSTLSLALTIEPSNEAALQLQKEALELDAHLRAEKVKEQGNIAFKAKRFDDAVELYTQAIEIWQDPVYLTNRAASYMAINKFRPALEDCQQAAILQSAYPSPKTLIRLARCQLVVDSPASALCTLSSVLSIEQSNEAALHLQKEALELDAHLRADKIKEEAIKAFEAEKFDDAVELYTKAIEIRLDPVYLTNRAACYMAIKKFQPALEDCQQAVTLQAASPSLKTLIRLARCQLVIDSPASVLSTLSSALSIDPSNEAALQLRKEALELDADLNAEKMKDEGNRAFEAKKFDDAIWFYTKAIQIRLDPVYLANRAASYMAIKKFRPALDDCQQAATLQSASPSPKTLIRLARCQLAVDSPMSALSTLSSALSIEPSNEAALQLKKEALELDAHLRAETIKEEGNIAFKAKNFDDAIELYTKAIEIRSDPAYLTNRAASYMAIKKFRPALEDCQQAVTLQSASPSPKTLIRLARCQLLVIGSPNSALSALRSALSIEPTNEAALHLQTEALELERHLQKFEGAKERKEWEMARLELGKCVQGIESQGGEIPTGWRLWKAELELTRGSWDAAINAANDAMPLESNSPEVLTLQALLLFLNAQLPEALQRVSSALRLDPGHEPSQKLRKRVKDVERLKNEGNVAFKADWLEEASDKYSQALEHVGKNEEEGQGGRIRATLLSNRATTFLKLEQLDEALEDAEASLRLVSTAFKALRTRARIHFFLEKYESSVSDFERAIEQAGFWGTDADVKGLEAELEQAVEALKRSMRKDYHYKILGIQRDCSIDEIKKAYRRESLKHHPDKGGDEEKFKIIGEAYSVLSDPLSRARYNLDQDELEEGMSDSSVDE